jgi:hypothetical protein
MGVDTKMKLTSNPKVEEVAEFLKQQSNISDVEITNYKDAEDCSYTNNAGEEVPYHSEATGYIIFAFEKDGEIEQRQLFFLENYSDKSENSSDLPFTPEHYFYGSVGMWGSSIEIMSLLATQFGGFVIPNDCADEEKEDFFIPFNTPTNTVIKSVALDFFNELGDSITITEKIRLLKMIENNKEAVANLIAVV